jgi:hypothetical protein
MRKGLIVSLVVFFGLSYGLLSPAADFNGDGTGNIAIFRASSGLWSVRGITRVYFGSTGDNPVPGDYDGNGTDSPAVFRAASGLWAARGVTRVYFGGSSDEAKPGDYSGDGTYDVGIFRGWSGLWAIKGVTRVYYGSSGDVAIAAGKAGGSGGGGGLPVTGQTTSYRAGDDGYYEKGTAFSYQTSDPAANGNIVTTDNVTGLMWASDGNAAGCNFANYTDWDHAIDWAEGLTFAGYSDWRLPNINELYSICVKDATISAPYIDHTYFPNTLNYYWSSTSYPTNTTNALYVYFNSGVVTRNDKAYNTYVRAVRGGE